MNVYVNVTYIVLLFEKSALNILSEANVYVIVTAFLFFIEKASVYLID
jgi:hypothetical protein